MKHHHQNGQRLAHRMKRRAPPDLTWEQRVDASVASLDMRVSKLEACSGAPSTWTPVWQDIVKRLPWESAGYVLTAVAILALNQSPHLQELLLKLVGIK